MPHIAAYHWPDGQLNQHTIPVFYDGAAYAITIDEAGSGGVKIFDVERVNKPKLAAQIKLEINLPANLDANLRFVDGRVDLQLQRPLLQRRPHREPDRVGLRLGVVGHPRVRHQEPQEDQRDRYLNPPTYRSTNPSACSTRRTPPARSSESRPSNS